MKATVERSLGSAVCDVEPLPPSRAYRLSGSLAGAATGSWKRPNCPLGGGAPASTPGTTAGGPAPRSGSSATLLRRSLADRRTKRQDSAEGLIAMQALSAGRAL